MFTSPRGFHFESIELYICSICGYGCIVCNSINCLWTGTHSSSFSRAHTFGNRLLIQIHCDCVSCQLAMQFVMLMRNMPDGDFLFPNSSHNDVALVSCILSTTPLTWRGGKRYVQSSSDTKTGTTRREKEKKWKKSNRNDSLNFKIAINWVGNDSANYVNADGKDAVCCLAQHNLRYVLNFWNCFVICVDGFENFSKRYNCSDTQRMFMFVRSFVCSIEVLWQQCVCVCSFRVCSILFNISISLCLSHIQKVLLLWFHSLANLWKVGLTLASFAKLAPTPFPSWIMAMVVDETDKKERS